MMTVCSAIFFRQTICRVGPTSQYAYMHNESALHHWKGKQCSSEEEARETPISQTYIGIEF